jgi:cell wall-associated NlpC family hydrolase
MGAGARRGGVAPPVISGRGETVRTDTMPLVEKASCTLPYTAVRKAPDEGSEQVTQALFADPLDVESREDGWAQVTVADGLQGWMQADALGEPLSKDRAHVVVVPQAADRYLGTWLVAPGLRTEPLAAARRKAGGDAIAETALMFLGAVYEWGGLTVHGLDCSGLVQAVHRRFGLLLPHRADQQETAGREVSLRQAQPGDLLCYGDHIAIWVGEGRIVHASSEHGKVVDEPHPADLKAKLRTVRRLYESED